MNGKTFTHVLLLLAMIFSQMATSAHMIEHMGDVPADSHHVVLQHGDHTHEHISIAQIAEVEKTERDCSIYHTYAGANGLAPVPCDAVTLNSNSKLIIQPLAAIFVARAPAVHPIRGPPALLIS